MEGDPQALFTQLAAELEKLGRILEHHAVAGRSNPARSTGVVGYHTSSLSAVALPRARRLFIDSTTFVSDQLLEGDAERVRARVDEAMNIATDERVGLTQLLERSIEELLAYSWWAKACELRADPLRAVAASIANVVARCGT